MGLGIFGAIKKLLHESAFSLLFCSSMSLYFITRVGRKKGKEIHFLLKFPFLP